MTTRRTLLVGITGATELHGGIACLNRNILRALDQLVAPTTETKLVILSLHEANSHRPEFLSPQAQFYGFESNKTAFALTLLRLAPTSALAFFDHVSLSYPLWPMARFGLVKTIIFAHGPEAWRNVRRRSIASYRAAYRVLANSDFTLRKMQTRFSGFSGVACPLGLNPDIPLHGAIAPPPPQAPTLRAVDGIERPLSQKALLLVGRMDRRQNGKGHHELLGALTKVLSSHPSTQLVFPGTGNAREDFINQARTQGVAASVFFPGFVSDELLSLLYRHCYAFVMPSRQDGFGLVYLEAMNFGMPCLGAYDDGGECVIIDGETGYLIDPESKRAGLIIALTKLLDDPQRARRMGEAGFQLLHDKFTATAFQHRLANELLPIFGNYSHQPPTNQREEV